MQRLRRDTSIPNHNLTTCAVKTIAAAGKIYVTVLGCDVAARDDVVVSHKFACSCSEADASVPDAQSKVFTGLCAQDENTQNGHYNRSCLQAALRIRDPGCPSAHVLVEMTGVYGLAAGVGLKLLSQRLKRVESGPAESITTII